MSDHTESSLESEPNKPELPETAVRISLIELTWLKNDVLSVFVSRHVSIEISFMCSNSARPSLCQVTAKFKRHHT